MDTMASGAGDDKPGIGHRLELGIMYKGRFGSLEITGVLGTDHRYTDSMLTSELVAVLYSF